MSLSSIYTELHRQAERHGEDRAVQLKRDCGVPATAVRFPAEEQGTKEHDGATWHYIAYRWREDGSA